MARRRTTLLIVDDEEKILAALRRSLRREGYEIVTASTPREALRILDEHEVDGILSDLKMPGMSGVDLLRKAGRLQPNAARLLITGWAQAVTQAEVSSAGIEAVIAKPWEDAELKLALREALS